MGKTVNHTGKTKTMNCGKVITIIGKAKRQNYYKMRTSDGFEFEGEYKSFKKGTIDPNQYINHIGETKTMNCGEVVTIIEASNRNGYYKMRTSDGFEFEGSYHRFKMGTINPDFYKTHIGEIRTMDCGEVVTIIGASNRNSWYKMHTSDGFEFEGSYRSFKRGTINPDLYKDHIGETKTMNCGLSAKCTNYKDTKNITICFEDGYTKNHVLYYKFNKGAVPHPELDINNPNRNFHGYKITGKRVNINGNVFYNAIRLSDGEKVYMTPQMMMAAEKEEK